MASYDFSIWIQIDIIQFKNLKSTKKITKQSSIQIIHTRKNINHIRIENKMHDPAKIQSILKP